MSADLSYSVTEYERPESWTERALCYGDPAPDDWFGGPDNPHKTSTEYQAAIKRAKVVCASCPVTRECYESAIESGETDGVFGAVDFGSKSERPKFPGSNPSTCRRGHLVAGDNIVRGGKGRIRCRTCWNEYQQSRAAGREAWAEIVGQP